MISVRRSGTPPVLATHGQRWTSELAAETDRGRKAVLQARYRNASVKRALVAMFSGKCAYCESRIVHIDYGHIEHFRPKATYEHLTFEWTNLYLACAVCNGAAYKGDRFPTTADGGPILDPCSEDPSSHLGFVFHTGPKLAIVAGTSVRGRTTAHLLGLNRPDLVAHRSRQIARLALLSRLARLDQGAADLWTEACQAAASGEEEYAAFVRALGATVQP